jgi:hypothetical protein
VNEPFRLFRREKVYYVQDNATGEQVSLRTKDKTEAKRLFHAKSEASRLGSLNLQIARTYMVAVDPELPTHTWRKVVRFIIEQKEPGPTRHRWEIVEKDKAFS